MEEVINIWYGTGENARLSNLAPRPFTYKEKKYRSVEHAYQTWKSGKFYQKGFDRQGGKSWLPPKTKQRWNLFLMKSLIYKSFLANPVEEKALLATGDVRLTHWQGKGIWKETFPRILTEVRTELKNNA